MSTTRETQRRAVDKLSSAVVARWPPLPDLKTLVLFVFDFGERVADPGAGDHVTRGAGLGLDFLPQTGDVHPQQVRLVAVRGAPDFGQQVVLGDDPPGVARQVSEDAVL